MKLGIIATKEFTKSFDNLLNQKGIPPKTAFRIKGIAKKLGEEVAKYKEINKECLDLCGLRHEDGTLQTIKYGEVERVILREDKKDDYNKRMLELNDIEVEVPELNLSDLGKLEDLTLLPVDYLNLDFIKED
jgi:hypothetical protein